MSARKKLNTVFLFIATGTAAFFGLMSGSSACLHDLLDCSSCGIH